MYTRLPKEQLGLITQQLMKMYGDVFVRMFPSLCKMHKDYGTLPPADLWCIALSIESCIRSARPEMLIDYQCDLWNAELEQENENNLMLVLLILFYLKATVTLNPAENPNKDLCLRLSALTSHPLRHLVMEDIQQTEDAELRANRRWAVVDYLMDGNMDNKAVKAFVQDLVEEVKRMEPQALIHYEVGLSRMDKKYGGLFTDEVKTLQNETEKWRNMKGVYHNYESGAHHDDHSMKFNVEATNQSAGQIAQSLLAIKR